MSSRISQKGFVFEKPDLLLVDSLKIYGDLSQKSDQELIPGTPLQSTLMNTIRRHSSQYQGRVTPQSIHSCQILAGKLRDRYDFHERRLLRHQFLPYDYMNVIARETESSRILLAFEESWALAGINDYISKQMSLEMSRTIRLREQMAVLQNEGYGSVSDLFGQDLFLKDLRIYQFDKLFMVFGPYDTIEASKIQLYLRRNIQLYDSNSYLVIRDMPLESALDLQYLYPLEISFMGNYLILSSDQLTLSELERIVQFDEVEFTFPRLDDLRAAYAAYLLSEALFYEFSIRWENRKLYVGLAGYLQARNISRNFADICTEVNREISRFEKFSDYRSAAEYCLRTNAKAFYYLGNYYVALGSKTDETEPREYTHIEDIEIIETKDPMRAVVHPKLGPSTKKYLQQLGYIVTAVPERYNPGLQLGYRTYEIVGETYTSYFYKATFGSEMEIAEMKGSHRPEIQTRLEDLLNRGLFFTQRMKNLLKGYPGFIPGDSPIPRFQETEILV